MERVKSKSERKIHRGRPRISQKKRDLVIKLYNEDEYICNISRLVGISESSVYNIVNERRQQYVSEESETETDPGKEKSYGVDFNFKLK